MEKREQNLLRHELSKENHKQQHTHRSIRMHLTFAYTKLGSDSTIHNSSFKPSHVVLPSIHPSIRHMCTPSIATLPLPLPVCVCVGYRLVLREIEKSQHSSSYLSSSLLSYPQYNTTQHKQTGKKDQKVKMRKTHTTTRAAAAGAVAFAAGAAGAGAGRHCFVCSWICLIRFGFVGFNCVICGCVGMWMC